MPRKKAHKPAILAALAGKPAEPEIHVAWEPIRKAIANGFHMEVGADGRLNWYAPGAWPPATPEPTVQHQPVPTPRKAVADEGRRGCCGDCMSYLPNRFGAGGIGRCAVLDNPPGGLLYPKVERRCPMFVALSGTTYSEVS